MARVAVLALLCVLLVAGCVGPAEPASPDTDAACEGADPVGENLDDRYNVSYGTADGFALTVTPVTVPRGEHFTVRLRNTADDARRRGSARKYAVHRWRDGDWHPVLAGAGGYNATAVEQPAGSAHVWRFAANESGMTAKGIEACGPLEAGRYRFVYFGLDGSEAVAVRFTVTED